MGLGLLQAAHLSTELCNFLNELQVQPQALSLGAHYTPRAQRAVHALEKRLCSMRELVWA
jgi:hypothetical protein